VVWEPWPASVFDDWVFDRVKGSIDFIALDYYYSLAPDLSVAHAARGEFWKVRFTPSALLTAIRDYHARAPGLPVYVVENGMATDDGLPRRDGMTRSRHLREHVYWLQRARAEGINVIGFNYWSLTDNYEWGDYRNRFGLYTVDVVADQTLRRKETDAVETYRELIKQRGVCFPSPCEAGRGWRAAPGEGLQR
jgi:beta-glucosidase